MAAETYRARKDIHLTSRKRKCVHILVGGFIVMAVVYVCIYLLQMPLITRPSPSSVSDYTRYMKILERYDKKLRNIPRNQYRPSSDFMDYGEPVKNFLPLNASTVKMILKWTTFFGAKNYIPSIIRCPGNLTCETTSDRAKLLTSDALVFHYRDYEARGDLPKQRLPHQRWVHFLMESPYNSHNNFHKFNELFNYTATYRRDSDAVQPYTSYGKKETPITTSEYRTLFSGLLRNKTKLVAAMVSNCEVITSDRLAYIKELQEHIHVDVYGKCGTLKCARGSDKCSTKLQAYKFFLTMENSNCRDYISEKVNPPLYQLWSVPVVMGGADPGDYERALPPNSYIHTAGFESPKDLAIYLQLLDRNPELYERHHRWRMNWKDTFDWEAYFCPLCVKLYNDSLPVQTYRDFSGWYEQDICKPYYNINKRMRVRRI